jgi:hypothetical protein
MSDPSRASRCALVAALTVATLGCGSRASLDDSGCDADGGVCACGPGIDAPPDEGRDHVPVGTTVSYRANPPASGPHYPMPAPWGVYTMPLARELWVHDLEHGGIVLAYNCPSGCDSLVAQLIAIKDGTPADQYNEQRFIITPDPKLPKTLAALAWDYRWQGDTLDVPTVRCFISARYDRAPESIP